MKQKNEMLTNKNGLALFVKGFGKRAKKIGLFAEYTQCVGMNILYFLFIVLGVRLFT